MDDIKEIINDVKELVDIADSLCSGYKDMPCSCEGCPIWDLKEYKKDEEYYKCPFEKILDKYKV